jgi:microcystin-dependent protein
MGQPYVGEIRMFAGNFAPVGWEFCNGQPLPIAENEALFQLIGTTYGGDGAETFNLPDYQSRIPIHMGNGPDGANYALGQMAGTEQETLSTQQIPSHSHPMMVEAGAGTANAPGGNVLASSANVKMYLQDAVTATLDPSAVSVVGGGQPHDNCQPFLCINYIISMFGIFPTQN